MLESVKQKYASIPGRPISETSIKTDALLQQEKQVEVKGPGETTFLELTWRAPAATENDFFVLDGVGQPTYRSNQPEYVWRRWYIQ